MNEPITHDLLLARARELELLYVKTERECDEIAGRIAENQTLIKWVTNPETHPLGSIVSKLESCLSE